MRKLLLVLLFTTSFMDLGFSQVGKIPYTVKEVDGKMRDQYHSILGHDANGFYALKTKTKGTAIYGIPVGLKAEIYIDYINQDLEVERTILLENYHWELANDVKNSVEFFHFMEGKNILKIVFTRYDDKTTQLFMGDVDLQTGEVANEILILSDTEADRRGTFVLIESSNNLFGLYSIVSSKEEKYASKVFTATFDPTFNLIKQNQVILPLKAKSSTSSLTAVLGSSALTNNTELIDKNGNISFLIRIDESKMIKLGMTDYNYHVIRISDDPGKFQLNTLGKDELYFLKDVLINEGENGNIVCVYPPR